MRTESIEYEADGLAMVGHLAVPEGNGPFPCVLLCHEGPGLDDHVRGRADRLAEAGYLAFALDYHGGGRWDFEANMGRLGELMSDADRTRALATAGLEQLLARPEADRSRVASIGFCFGGAMATELARTGADLLAIVGFHPSLVSPKPEDSTRITAKVLMCVGAADPIVDKGQRDAFEQDMTTHGVDDWRMEVYGGVEHSFTNPAASGAGIPGIAYDAAADRRSWRAMLDLFDEVF